MACIWLHTLKQHPDCYPCLLQGTPHWKTFQKGNERKACSFCKAHPMWLRSQLLQVYLLSCSKLPKMHTCSRSASPILAAGIWQATIRIDESGSKTLGRASIWKSLAWPRVPWLCLISAYAPASCSPKLISSYGKWAESLILKTLPALHLESRKALGSMWEIPWMAEKASAWHDPAPSTLP